MPKHMCVWPASTRTALRPALTLGSVPASIAGARTPDHRKGMLPSLSPGCSESRRPCLCLCRNEASCMYVCMYAQAAMKPKLKPMPVPKANPNPNPNLGLRHDQAKVKPNPNPVNQLQLPNPNQNPHSTTRPKGSQDRCVVPLVTLLLPGQREASAATSSGAATTHLSLSVAALTLTLSRSLGSSLALSCRASSLIPVNYNFPN